MSEDFDKINAAFDMMRDAVADPASCGPLLETDVDALTKLFESDPLELTYEGTLSAIRVLRARRDEFASQEAAKSLAPKKTRAKATLDGTPAASLARDIPVTEVNLDD